MCCMGRWKPRLCHRAVLISSMLVDLSAELRFLVFPLICWFFWPSYYPLHDAFFVVDFPYDQWLISRLMWLVWLVAVRILHLLLFIHTVLPSVFFALIMCRWCVNNYFCSLSFQLFCVSVAYTQFHAVVLQLQGGPIKTGPVWALITQRWLVVEKCVIRQKFRNVVKNKRQICIVKHLNILCLIFVNLHYV